MASSEERLAFAKFAGTLMGQAKATADRYPGFVCYHDAMGGHFWIQRYNDDGSVWLLHGRDSVLPGLDVPSFEPESLTQCGCGKWMPGTKEQTNDSRQIAAATVMAVMEKN